MSPLFPCIFPRNAVAKKENCSLESVGDLFLTEGSLSGPGREFCLMSTLEITSFSPLSWEGRRSPHRDRTTWRVRGWGAYTAQTSGQMHSFPIAVAVNHHRGGDWTQIYYLKFGKSEVRKSVCQQGCVPSGGPRGESVSLPFAVSRGHLLSWAQSPLPLSLEPASQNL